MRAHAVAALTLFVVAACGGKDAAAPVGGTDSAGVEAPSAGPADAGGQAANDATAPSPSEEDAGAGLNGRTGELLNPDENTVVFLYYDLAGIPPPIDQWVQKDTRVFLAQPIDKEATRRTIRSEFESGLASVRNAGFIRLALNSANLSDYDPTYGEFTIRALSPSSEVPFNALGQKVAIKFANGRTAQIWKVPAAEAQLIRDKVGMGAGNPNVDLELLLRIKSVMTGPAEGTIVTDIVEYEMRETRGGTTIHRARVAP